MSSTTLDAQQQLEQLRAVMHATRGAVIMQPDDCEVPTHSAAARRLLGLDLPADLQPIGWIHADRRQCAVADLPHERARRTHVEGHAQTMGLVWPDQRVTWLSFESAFWSAANARHGAGVVTTFTDVTSAVEATEQLARMRDQLARALAGAHEGFWDWHVPSGRVEYSAHWARMLGRSTDDLVHGLGLYEAIAHPEDRERHRHVLNAYLRGDLALAEVEERWRHVDGHWVWLQFRSSVTERSPDGRPLRLAGTVTDVSARKLAELALREALDAKDALLVELNASMAKVKTLTALLPMCAWCRRLRSDEGYWSSLEQYLERHTESRVTHSICPSCTEDLIRQGDTSSEP